MPESPEDLPREKRIYCNRCKNSTNHSVKGEHCSQSHVEENGRLLFWEEMGYRLWICSGCDEGTLESCYTNDSYRDGNGDLVYDLEYFPPRKQGYIPLKKFRKLPRTLAGLYGESVEAYNNKLLILCAGGLRALIEGICVDKEITGDNLASKIDAMTSILPKNIVENLHNFRFMGNKALHELNPPDRKDLRIAIEVSEDLMNYIYDLDYKASLLRKSDKKKQIT